MKIFKKNYIIGLDIGSSSVKIARFVKREDGLHLLGADLKEIAFVEDEALREKEILTALKRLLKDVEISKSKFVVSIDCPQTAIKKITMPYMPIGELRDSLMLGAKNHFPFSITQAQVDFEILGDIVEKGVKKYQILVATSPKKTIDRYLSMLSKVNIKPASFIPASLALQRTVENFSFPQTDTAKAVLEIGERFSEIVIFSANPAAGNPQLIFQRKIPVAGRDFTKAMTSVLASEKGRIGLSLEEAEKIKKEIGIPDRDDFSLINDKVSARHIFSMIRASLESLLSEIERCFDYYREFSDEKINSLILLGGGSALKGLVEFLSQGLAIEVKVGNALEGLKIEKGVAVTKDVSSRLAQAVGAALKQAKGINLLPVEIKEKMKQTLHRATIQAVVAVIILMIAFIYTGMKIQLANFNKRIAVARVELASVKPQLARAIEQSLANKILAGEPYWEDIFKELSNVVPQDIYLTELSFREKDLIIKGIITLEEGAEEVLSDFIFVLEKGIFKGAKLISVRESVRRGSVEFEIGCRIK